MRGMKTTSCCVWAFAAALSAASLFGTEPAKPLDVVAVYYPHWHQYPKGDEWFGPSWKEGEWTFVKTMKSRFPGHKVFKPLPGYLSGKDPADVETEIELASGNGINVFLYDYYWYNGQKTQEEAIEQGFLKAKNRGKMKFALMWCYHERVNSFRPPYVKERKPLMNLAHTPEEFLGLIDYSITHYFNQPEYWRKDGKLFLSVYNVPYLWEKWGKDAAKVKNAFAEARRRVKAAGLGELHINGQNVWPASLLPVVEELGFDSLTDYGLTAWQVPNYRARWNAGERVFGFQELDGVLQKHWAEMRKGKLPYIPVVPTGWDATARCRNDVAFPWNGADYYPYCGTFTNAVPEVFEKYLRDAKAAAEADPKKPGAVYINAWNEYTEGCFLLPNVRGGDLMLRCVGRVFGRNPSDKLTSCTMKHWWDPKAKNGTAFTVDMPTYENLKYGPHMRQSLDVWLPARSAGMKTPVLINIHGGGWSDGDRLGGIASMWPKCRKEGIALVSISYRMVHDARDAGIKPPVKACLDDAVAAIEYVKAHADAWGLDVGRIGLTGGSAGACSSLYASLQGDCALGIRALLVHSPQTSIDPKEMKEWIPNSRYGSHAFGYGSFKDWLEHRADVLPWIEKFSPAGLLRACTAAKAPVFLYTCPALPKAGELPADPTHAAMFCVKFEEICKSRGIACRRGNDSDLFAELKK